MKRIENQKMSKMPFTYLMYRLAVKGVMKKNFPDEGFETEWIRCDKTEIHFDLHRCIYNDLTKEYEFPELFHVLSCLSQYAMESSNSTMVGSRGFSLRTTDM